MKVLFQGSAQITLVISRKGTFFLKVQDKSFHHLPRDSCYLVILWRMLEMLSAVESLGSNDVNLAFVAAGGQISDLPKRLRPRQGDVNEFIRRIKEHYWQIVRKPIPLIIVAAIELYSLPENGK